MMRYLGLILDGRTRSQVRDKFAQVEKTLDLACKAILHLKWYELGLLVEWNAGLFDTLVLPGREPKHLERIFKLDPKSDPERVALVQCNAMLGFRNAAGTIANLLRGTAQDCTRPHRYVVHRLYKAWIANGWPRPIWRGAFEPFDPYTPDGDLFCDVVRLLFDGLRTRLPFEFQSLFETRGVPAGFPPEKGQIEHALRELLDPRTARQKKLQLSANCPLEGIDYLVHFASRNVRQIAMKGIGRLARLSRDLPLRQ
jgi:hypothetical protein